MQVVKALLIGVTAVAVLALVMGASGGPVHHGDNFFFSFPFDGHYEEGTFDRTLNVSGAVDLRVTSGSGHISVHQGSASQVAIHATVKARSNDGMDAAEHLKQILANPPIEQNGSSIEIGKFHDSDLGNNVSISYDITVPQQTRLVSHTGSGGQEVDGINGPVEVKAGSGSVRVNNIAADVKAHTGSGGIEVNNVQGSLEASAGSGSMKLSNIGPGSGQGTPAGANAAMTSTAGARIDVSTGSGGIRMQNVKGAVEAEAGSGHISADGQMLGEWNLRTGSGGVDVHLPANAAFDLDAHTGSGGLSVEQPITMQGAISRRDIRGKVRGGGPLLQIRTGSGGISVE